MTKRHRSKTRQARDKERDMFLDSPFQYDPQLSDPFRKLDAMRTLSQMDRKGQDT